MSIGRKKAIAGLASALILSVVASTQILATEAGEPIPVIVDQATIVKLPPRITTLIVGNPLIADVSLQPGGAMVVTGKGYGSTNVMALDRDGAVLLNRIIRVDGPSDKLVTVFRGVSRETYSCTPVCEQRITLGDGPDYFKATLEQSGSLSAAAGASPDK